MHSQLFDLTCFIKSPIFSSIKELLLGVFIGLLSAISVYVYGAESVVPEKPLICDFFFVSTLKNLLLLLLRKNKLICTGNSGHTSKR